jgi:hypothetical protein
MKRLRQIAPWLGWVLAVPAFLQLNWPARLRDVEARSFTIRDASGTKRITIGMDHGTACLTLRDDAGVRRVTLESASDEQAALRFWSGEQRFGDTFHAGRDGRAWFIGTSGTSGGVAAFSDLSRTTAHRNGATHHCADCDASAGDIRLQ